MKKIWLVRHAKSSWDFPELPDFERPLNARGNNDARAMADWILNQPYKPDVLVTSTAKRTIQTARYFAASLPSVKVLEAPNLYEAMPSIILQVIHNLKEEWSSVMLFGHNPGLHLLVSSLSYTPLEKFPTCAIACLESPALVWEEVTLENTKVSTVWSPKTIS